MVDLSIVFLYFCQRVNCPIFYDPNDLTHQIIVRLLNPLKAILLGRPVPFSLNVYPCLSHVR